MKLPSLFLCLTFSLLSPHVRAGVFEALNGELGDELGTAVAVSGNLALGTAPWADDGRGFAYLFGSIGTATGLHTERAVLSISEEDEREWYASGVALSGNGALVSDHHAEDYRGVVYYYHGLDSVTGAKTEDVRLTASDRAEDDTFGRSIALQGVSAVVGASGGEKAYFFRNVASGGSTITEDTILTASDNPGDTAFGRSVSLSGERALVGAFLDSEKASEAGAAYVYHDLHLAGATKTQDVKLTASDAAEADNFGIAVSLSGNAALVGADRANSDGWDSGTAYFYRDVSGPGTERTEDVRLTASHSGDREYHFFGRSLSLVGDTALVGASGYRDGVESTGAAYLFLDLNSAGAARTEDVLLLASQRQHGDYFGSGVALDGDTFVIGARGAEGNAPESGRLFSGSVESVTTLDEGDASRVISGISFVSQRDWVVGETTSRNTVILSEGDLANVSAPGATVFIGRNAGSNGNRLEILGELLAEEVRVGSVGGNTGNTLRLGENAILSLTTLSMTAGNLLEIEGGDYSDINQLLTRLDGTLLQVWTGGGWAEVDVVNHASLLTLTYTGGDTRIEAIPEPAVTSLLLATLGGWLAVRRRFHS